jgi:hypothetical protein
MRSPRSATFCRVGARRCTSLSSLALVNGRWSAVAQAYAVSPDEVRQRYARAGDLGLVVAELASAENAVDRPVREVFADLCARCSPTCARGVRRPAREVFADLRARCSPTCARWRI